MREGAAEGGGTVWIMNPSSKHSCFVRSGDIWVTGMRGDARDIARVGCQRGSRLEDEVALRLTNQIAFRGDAYDDPESTTQFTYKGLIF